MRAEADAERQVYRARRRKLFDSARRRGQSRIQTPEIIHVAESELITGPRRVHGIVVVGVETLRPAQLDRRKEAPQLVQHRLLRSGVDNQSTEIQNHSGAPRLRGAQSLRQSEGANAVTLAQQRARVRILVEIESRREIQLWTEPERHVRRECDRRCQRTLAFQTNIPAQHFQSFGGSSLTTVSAVGQRRLITIITQVE